MQTAPDPIAPANTMTQAGRRHRGRSLTVEPSCKDEARVGQQGTLTRSGPGAVPARARCATGASTGHICSARCARPVALAPLLALPTVNIEAMNKHLIEIGKCVSAGAIALLIVDGAGWHSSPKLAVPENIVLLKLPPYAPELNPAENIWEYLRGNTLSHQVWETYDAIVDACCDAWNGLMRAPDLIRSIATRKWAQVRT